MERGQKIELTVFDLLSNLDTNWTKLFPNVVSRTSQDVGLLSCPNLSLPMLGHIQ